MSDVVLSGAIRANLLSMQNTAKLLSETNVRLATGLKVNSAIDDPTAFFTARSLDTRATDLTSLLDQMDQAVQTLTAADEGIKSLTKLVETAKATATQALDTPINASFKEGPRDAFPDQTLKMTAVFSSIASTEVITVAFGGAAAQPITVGGKTVSQFVSSINGLSGVSASITTNGSLRIEADDGSDLVIASSTGSVATDLGVVGTFDNGQNRSKFETDFNTLRVQINELALDASYQGVNLLNGDDFTVNFNESQTSQMTMQGVVLNSVGLGIGAVTTDDFKSEATIRTFIAELDGAISKLRTQSSTFGANLGVVEIRQGFTDRMVNTLETGAANLTLADTNEEGANLLALQTRQSLGTTALSIASQAEQNVLQLF
jgi:flagellin